MIKVLILFGPSGSGKDTLLTEALKRIPNLHKPIFYTTRPMREGEVNGVNYNFVSKEEFEAKLLNNEFLEAAVFNGWGYASSLDNFDEQKVNIVALDGERAGLIAENLGSKGPCKCFFIKAKDKTRLLRQLKREENPNVDEIIRRYESDKKDYAYIPFSYHSLINEDRNDLKKNIEILRYEAKTMQSH